jgi:hypothetical protein
MFRKSWRVSGHVQDRHVPHWLARQARKVVPLLLVADRRASDSDGVRVDELTEPHERLVLRVDGAGEPKVARGVLVPDVHDGRVGERGVHFRGGALKEDAAAGDEERVARVSPVKTTPGTDEVSDLHVRTPECDVFVFFFSSEFGW